MIPELDYKFVRSQFPAFNEPNLQGQAFFDNAGGSYACKQVIDHLNRYYCQTKMQPYGMHPASKRAGAEMDRTYQKLANYLGVSSDEVHIGPSTSQNTYVLAQAFANIMSPGDEVIVTNQDHEANTGVWRRLSDRGIVVKEWSINPETGMLDIDELSELLTDKTRLVAFTHCSNILGFINPVAKICEHVHAAGAIAVVDGVSFAGHGFPNVSELNADIYLLSLYKTFGPHQGVMVIRAPLIKKLGNQAHYFLDETLHKWFTPAGPDHAQVAASSSIASYFDALHAHHFGPGEGRDKANDIRQLFSAAERSLLSTLLDFCHSDPRVRLVGPSSVNSRAATVSLEILNSTPIDISSRLADKGIIAGAGHFYAARLMTGMNISPKTGLLRLSFVHYTSPEEVKELINALDTVL